MIDLHCHVLPGIDDGPEILEESVVMGRAAARAGTTVLVATPHVSHSYPNDAVKIAARVEAVRERLRSEDFELDVRAGAEIALATALEMEPHDLARLSLGGGHWLLVEPPFNPASRNLEAHFGLLRDVGCGILIAHPERCAAFQREPAALRALVDAGCLCSLTAGSLVGRFGEDVRRFALTLLRDGLAHNVASDAHDLYARPPGTHEAIEQSGGGALEAWLTCEVPAAILAGEEIPARPEVDLPEVERARRWRWSRGRPVRTS